MPGKTNPNKKKRRPESGSSDTAVDAFIRGASRREDVENTLRASGFGVPQNVPMGRSAKAFAEDATTSARRSGGVSGSSGGKKKKKKSSKKKK